MWTRVGALCSTLAALPPEYCDRHKLGTVHPGTRTPNVPSEPGRHKGEGQE